MHPPDRRAELARDGRGALEPDLFAHAEHKDDGMLQLGAIEPAERQDQGRASHAIVEGPAGRARPGEPYVLLWHRDRLADGHAQRFRARARRGTDADAERRGSATREPGVARQKDAGDVATITVNQRGLGLKQGREEAAAIPQGE